nr:hypothetical protein HUO10_003279 [Paraburkholderia busanensis]
MADVIDVESAESQTASPPAVRQQSSLAQQAGASITTPADLLRLAIQTNADLDRLEKLMELQQRWEANEARKGFVAAMTEFKRTCPPIFKRKAVGYNTKDGDFVGYRHAELSDVTDVLGPAMGAYGLTYDWDIRQSPGKIEVDCIVTHVLGHSKKVSMEGPPDNSGKKNVLQQGGSTITYLQRYTLLAASGMSTKGEDDDGQGGAEGDHQPSASGQQQATQQRTASQDDRPTYSDEKFQENKSNWKVIVTTGRKTPAKMITFIESKGHQLTSTQKKEIESWANQGDK